MGVGGPEHPRRQSRLAVGVAVVALLTPLVSPSAFGASSRPVPNEVVVTQLAGPSVQPGSVLAGLPGIGPTAAAHDRYLLRVPVGEVPGVVARLDSNPDVKYATVAQSVHATAAPKNPCYDTGCVALCGNTDCFVNQDYLNTIGAPGAWAVTHGKGVTVAVLDTGADAKQPDLRGKFAGPQVDVCLDDDPACGGQDKNGHGTHVSGIVAADTNSGIGVASLGWAVKLREYQVLDAYGDGNTADVATAIYDAVDAGYRVINMSFANYSCAADPSDCGPDPDETAAVEYALAHDVVVVAAAGNDGFDSPTYPASYTGVLAVAATNTSGQVQSFSQWGSAANIAAPGLDIVSTWITRPPKPEYAVLSGTSMAAPEVSAAAALMIARNRGLSGPQVTALLEKTARPTTGGNPIQGGLLDVPAALAAEAHPPVSYEGYDLAGSDGSVYPFGSVAYFGDLRGRHLDRPVVAVALRENGLGYWMDASDGGVFSFGGAGFFGSLGGVRLARPVVGMEATPDGRGYWLVGSDGGVFTFGDAGFFGSLGGVRLARPVVGMEATPDGQGYWLVASDGGIFAFGDARFYGSTGNVHLTKPVVGMAVAPDGRGYWLVGSDGGVFTFGDAGFWGSTGRAPIPAPVVGATS